VIPGQLELSRMALSSLVQSGASMVKSPGRVTNLLGHIYALWALSCSSTHFPFQSYCVIRTNFIVRESEFAEALLSQTIYSFLIPTKITLCKSFMMPGHVDVGTSRSTKNSKDAGIYFASCIYGTWRCSLGPSRCQNPIRSIAHATDRFIRR
jgi:hypothetical protein